MSIRFHSFLRSAACAFGLSALLFTLGCSDANAPAENAATPASNSDSSENPAGSDSAMESSADVAEIVLLDTPTGLPEELAQEYEQLTKLDDSAQRNLELSIRSQQIAGIKLQDAPDSGHEFFVQSGQLLRQALAAGVQDFPQDATAIIYFNQALGHAHAGDDQQSFNSLKDAVETGFSMADGMRGDPEFESVREMDGFDALLAKAEENAAKNPPMPAVDFIAEAKKDLASIEPFDFSLSINDLEGNPVSLSAEKGKVVIVDLWATWCGPCRMEIPSFVKLKENYADQGFEIIGVNFENESSEEESLKVVKDFANEFGINYPCGLGSEDILATVPGFRGFPTTLFFDKSGTVRAMAVGHRPYEYHAVIVEQLLAEDDESNDEEAEATAVPVPVAGE